MMQKLAGRRFVTWLGAGVLIVGAVSWAGAGCFNRAGDESRPVSQEEADRLAKVRAENLELGTIGMLATLPEELGGGELDGWVDWTQPIVHAGMKPAESPAYEGLVQSVPGLVATRAGDAPPDPAAVPEDGWSVRRVSGAADGVQSEPERRALDIVLSAVLVLGSSGTDDAAALRESALWLDETSIDGVAVDVFRAPLVSAPAPEPSTSGTSTAGASGSAAPSVAPTPAQASPEAMLFVDRDGLLRRFQVNPGGHGLATVDLLVGKRPDAQAARVPAIDLLGGPPVQPREVTEKEARTLAGMRQRNAGTVSAVDVVMPVADGEVLRAAGWVDWRQPLAYLTMDYPGEERDGLLFVLPGGAGFKAEPVTGDTVKRPPMPAPADGWTTEPWADRIDENTGASDLDILLFKLLMLASPLPDDEAAVKDSASWLREGKLGKTKTTTFEFPMAGDQAAPSGQAPFRYWVASGDGTLRRVEMRTRAFGLAHADLKAKDPGWITVPGAVMSGLM